MSLKTLLLVGLRLHVEQRWKEEHGFHLVSGEEVEVMMFNSKLLQPRICSTVQGAHQFNVSGFRVHPQATLQLVCGKTEGRE